jgi:hypothetical protein
VSFLDKNEKESFCVPPEELMFPNSLSRKHIIHGSHLYEEGRES